MNFLGGSIQLGRVFGISVRIHVLFLVWIGIELFTAGDNWRLTLAMLTVVFGSVLLHEFGHCWGARRVGGRAEEILLWPLGGLAYVDAPMQPKAQFVTVVCGPLVNLLLCVAALIVLLASAGPSTPLSPDNIGLQEVPTGWRGFVLTVGSINLLLMCFNLLPVYPLDGGRLLCTLLWRFVGQHRATLISAQVGVAGAVLMGIAGWTYGEGILICIAVFGGLISFQHYRAARYGLATERFVRTDHLRQEKRPRRGWWSRRLGSESRAPDDSPEVATGPREPSQTTEAVVEDDETALERIRRKVAEHGPHSLSYVERQQLERIVRQHQQTENEDDRDTPG